MLELNNLFAGYFLNTPILKNINLRITSGDVVAIIGKNGSGKSTLAKSLINLVPYTEGDITWNGSSLLHESTNLLMNRGIGFFFQGGRVFPNLTVSENLQLSKVTMGISKPNSDDSFLGSYIEKFISDKGKQIASFLSGGQQHILAILMVLITHPQLLILDEPSAGLSPESINVIYDLIHQYRLSEQPTIILIEQNLQVAFKYSERIILLEKGEIQLSEASDGKMSQTMQNEYFNVRSSK